jgi:hypothetical protein
LPFILFGSVCGRRSRRAFYYFLSTFGCSGLLCEVLLVGVVDEGFEFLENAKDDICAELD